MDSATGTGVTFATSTATYAHSFAVTLDNAPLRVLFAGNMAFAANNLTVTTARNIVVNTGANVTATSGNITLAANLQATPTIGDFSGVFVDGVVTSVSGTVSVTGRGGLGYDDGPNGVTVTDGTPPGTTGSWAGRRPARAGVRRQHGGSWPASSPSPSPSAAG